MRRLAQRPVQPDRAVENEQPRLLGFRREDDVDRLVHEVDRAGALGSRPLGVEDEAADAAGAAREVERRCSLCFRVIVGD